MDAQDGLGEEGGMVKEEGGGWEVEEDLDLPPELVSQRRATLLISTVSYIMDSSNLYRVCKAHVLQPSNVLILDPSSEMS